MVWSVCHGFLSIQNDAVKCVRVCVLFIRDALKPILLHKRLGMSGYEMDFCIAFITYKVGGHGSELMLSSRRYRKREADKNACNRMTLEIKLLQSEGVEGGKKHYNPFYSRLN